MIAKMFCEHSICFTNSKADHTLLRPTNKKFWEEIIAYFPSYVPDQIENDASKNSIVACIHCRGKVFTDPLPSTDRGIHVQTYRLMGGIYEVCRWNRLRCHDMHTEFHKDWYRHSKVNWGDSQTHRQHGDRISLLSLFQNKESRQKMEIGVAELAW
jgi:hypothetical protein